MALAENPTAAMMAREKPSMWRVAGAVTEKMYKGRKQVMRRIIAVFSELVQVLI